MGKIHFLRLVCAISFVILLYTCRLSIAGERFQPRGCEFSVEFPGKPTVVDIFNPTTGNVQTAEYRGGSGKPSDSYFFVAEGMPISKTAILAYHEDFNSFLLEGAQTYAEANGLQHPEFKLFEDDLGKGIGMRAYKKIGGVPVIYSTMSLLGEKSIIHLRIGCAAEFFPPPGMTRFIKSVARN